MSNKVDLDRDSSISQQDLHEMDLVDLDCLDLGFDSKDSPIPYMSGNKKAF